MEMRMKFRKFILGHTYILIISRRGEVNEEVSYIFQDTHRHLQTTKIRQWRYH